MYYRRLVSVIPFIDKSLVKIVNTVCFFLRLIKIELERFTILNFIPYSRNFVLPFHSFYSDLEERSTQLFTSNSRITKAKCLA